MLVKICPTNNGFLRSATFANATVACDEAAEIDHTLLNDISNVFFDSATASRIGSVLYGWLFGDVGDHTAIYPKDGLEPIYLCFEPDPEQATAELNVRLKKLASLPWELLLTPAGGYLARDPRSGVFRISGEAAAPELPKPAWPMRVVAVSGADIPNENINTMQELQDLRKIFVGWGRSVNLEVIEQATNRQLDTIKSDCPAILHYCGHSVQLKGNAPSLVTAGPERGSRDYFSYAQIGGLQEPNIGLVVLNACRTALAVGEVEEPIWQQSLATMFLRNGSRAVIAMQADFAGADAMPFAGGLYEALLAGKSLEDAVTYARSKIKVDNTAWAIPSLTLACMPGPAGYKLFDRQRAVQSWLPFGGTGELSPKFTANFHRERRIMSNWLCGTSSETSLIGPVALLVGEANAGKSHFMRWALSNVAHLSHQFRYIDFATFKPEEKFTLVRLLRAIRDGAARNQNGTFDCDARLRAPFSPVGAFNAFNETLNRAFGSNATAPAPAAAHSVVPDLYLTGSTDAFDSMRGLTFNEHIAQLFLSGLQAVAAASPLFIVIDLGSNASRMEVSELKPFITKVMIAECERWSREGKGLPSIRFVVCCHRSDLQLRLEDWCNWFRFEVDDRLPIIEFKNNYTNTDIVNFIKEMYWFKLDEQFYQTAKTLISQTPNIGIEACRKSYDLVQLFEEWKKTIDDPVSGIRDMR